MKRRAVSRVMPSNAEAEAACELLKALASPHRLMIACRLAEGAETVGALAAHLSARESVVSQHLAVLRRQRLVSSRREGQQVRYALKSQAARDIITVLAHNLCGVDLAQTRRS